jgi:hypothetical protein
MGLSNHHVFVGVGGRKGDKIAQPFTRDSGFDPLSRTDQS